MSNRRGKLTPAQGAELGGFVLGLRNGGASWKEIEDVLGMSRRQVWRHVRRHLMSQQKRLMSHHGDCSPACAA